MKLKNGFSLAEILLVLGIISIVTTMGMTISSHGISKAYNLYFYTGFANLYDGIAETTMQGDDIDNNFTDFVTKLSELFDGKNLTINNKAGEFTAKNNIVYNIEQFDTYINPDTNERDNIYKIEMAVPVTKKRNTDPNRAIFMYFPNLRNGQIYPSCVDINGDPSYVCIALRADLLPYYIDTGFNGRNRDANLIMPPDNNNANGGEENNGNGNGESNEQEETLNVSVLPNYEKRTYDSFARMYGRLYDNIPTTKYPNGILTIISNQNKQIGVLKFANPNKVF